MTDQFESGRDARRQLSPGTRGCHDPVCGALILVAVAGYVFLGLHWLRPLDFVLWLVFSLLAGLPGWAAWLALRGMPALRRVEFWAGGVIMGWAFTSYALLVVGYLAGKVVLWPLWVLAGVSVIGIIFGVRRSGAARLPGVESWDRGSRRVLAFAAAVVIVFIARPFWSVGTLTPDGYAFPWLFGFDFTNRVSIAANVAVSLPPKYFHIHGETFHYYLLTYLFPVAFKKLAGGSAEMFAALLMWCVNLAVAFTIILVWALRDVARNSRVLLLSVLTSLAAYSFYWVYVAAKVYAREGVRVHSIAR